MKICVITDQLFWQASLAISKKSISFSQRKPETVHNSYSSLHFTLRISSALGLATLCPFICFADESKVLELSAFHQCDLPILVFLTDYPWYLYLTSHQNQKELKSIFKSARNNPSDSGLRPFHWRVVVLTSHEEQTLFQSKTGIQDSGKMLLEIS